MKGHMQMETLSENRCFDGVQGVYKHASTTCNCDMTFAVFMPREAEFSRVPILWFLSGLTCTHENAMVKAGAQLWAADHGIALVFPDTSPRGDEIADDEAYDLGQGAGFYVNATQAPWSDHFQMFDYINGELSGLLVENFAIDADRQSVSGHSMGGHGALTWALKEPSRFRSASAFAPICNPTQSDWGQKQFAAYLGDDASVWKAHDATVLMGRRALEVPMLIDTGTNDQFFDLLGTDAFAAAFAKSRQPGQIRLQQGYDHSYFFISSFIEEHLAFHADALLS